MNENIWGPATKHFVINMSIPLAFSVFFCLKLYFKMPDLILPLSLLLYGLTLFNASKFADQVIRYFGIVMMILGLLTLFAMQYHILIWTFGFGVLHIVFGILMVQKKDNTNA
ncbi:MAG: hypothetical protein R2852_06745 [Bacteroidia bacterium]